MNRRDAKNPTKGIMHPSTAAFSVKLDNVKSLTATSGCNLDGIWSSSIKV